jgi:NitT/TauT family transport system substrate-binding protein
MKRPVASHRALVQARFGHAIIRTVRRTVVAFVLAAGVTANAAQADTKIRFTLDWIPGSVHAPFFIALYKGYYKAEGLDVTIDRGKGSAEVVRQLASGVYDLGYPDINILMDFNSKNPNQAFPILMMGYEQAPAAIIVLKSSGITEPKQLEGKTMGSAANDSTFKLFPLFAKAAGVDADKVKIQYIEPKLREALLARKDVDAIPGQMFNAILELKAKGLKEDDVRAFLYKDYGLDIYGNGIAAARNFLKDNPEAIKGFIRATIKGAQDMVRDPELAVQMTLKFESLLNAEIERDRLKMAMSCCMVTPNVLTNGFGGVDAARLKRSILLITQGYALPREVSVEETFNPAFLPPPKERMVK